MSSVPISGLEFGNADFNGGRDTGEPGDRLSGQSEDLFSKQRLIWTEKELFIKWYKTTFRSRHRHLSLASAEKRLFSRATILIILSLFLDILLLDCNLNVIQPFLFQSLAVSLCF